MRHYLTGAGSRGVAQAGRDRTTTIDDVESLGQNMIDRAFNRALVFLLIALVGFIAAWLAYRWLELRFFGAPA